MKINLNLYFPHKKDEEQKTFHLPLFMNCGKKYY